MPDAPLVSVMMPCFNAAETLPMALASLAAQTYPNWEAVIVDDGSTDDTWQVLQGRSDDRLRLYRFAENRGRGAARQQCLDMVRGEYLALLDADDWQYPNRLRYQVERMQSDSKVTMISNGFVVLGEDERPLGAACPGLPEGADVVVRKLRHVRTPPLAFPPAMIRMADARGALFNPRFRRSQDSDFVLQFLIGRYYAVDRKMLYVHRYNWNAALDNTIEGYKYRVASHWQYVRQDPLHVLKSTGMTLGKIGAYRTAGYLGLHQHLVRRRWPPVTQAVAREFEEMQNRVSAYL